MRRLTDGFEQARKESVVTLQFALQEEVYSLRRMRRGSHGERATARWTCSISSKRTRAQEMLASVGGSICNVQRRKLIYPFAQNYLKPPLRG